MSFEMTEEMRIKIKTLLIKHEGFRNHLYKDSRDKWTIGIGHNIDDLGLKDKFINEVFYDDIDDHVKFLSSFEWFHALDENRQCALIDLAYNVGDKNFENFVEMIKALESKNMDKASQEILDSKISKERAQDLAEILLTGNL
jgi:GH24 family phage-related lysozyme (muramidase)